MSTEYNIVKDDSEGRYTFLTEPEPRTYPVQDLPWTEDKTAAASFSDITSEELVRGLNQPVHQGVYRLPADSFRDCL
jgi:hypothetical protein